MYYAQVKINSPSGHVIPVYIPIASSAAVSLPVALSAIPKFVTTDAASSVMVVPKSDINTPASSAINNLTSTASLSTPASASAIQINGTVQRNTVSAPASSSGIANTTKEVQ
jgi:hypothetical protein